MALPFDGTRAHLDTRAVAADVAEALTRAHRELGEQLRRLPVGGQAIEAAGLRDNVGHWLEDLGVDLEDPEHGLRVDQ